MATKGFTYVCSHCGETCTSEWSDEEAQKEASELWGGLVAKPEETRLVCDPCFKLFYDPRTAPADAEA